MNHAQTSKHGLGLSLLVTLAAISAVSPIATDTYLPAFTQMASDLGVGASMVQLTMTMFLVGTAIGQLVFGVLSDQYGRRGFLIAGTALALAAAVGTAIAPNIAVLHLCRFVQGLGGAAGGVLARAIIADRARGVAAAKAMSLVMAIQGVAPVIAPIVGGLLVDIIGWRGIMAVVAGYTALAWLMILLWAPETLPKERRVSGGFKPLVEGTKALSKDHTFVRFILTIGFAFALLMAYLAATPFILRNILGYSTLTYTFVFSLCALMISVTATSSGILAARVSPAVQAKFGLRAVLLVDLVIAVVCIAALQGPNGHALARYGIPALLMMHVGSLGFMFGNLSALSIERCGRWTGTGSALMGFCQFVFGGIASPLVGLSGEQSGLAFGVVVLAIAVVANLCGQGPLSRERDAVSRKVEAVLESEKGEPEAR